MEDSVPDRFQTFYIAVGFLIMFVCVFGVIGNILSIMVLTRPKMHTSFNIFLVNLAVADTLHLIAAIPVMWVPSFLESSADVYYQYDNFYVAWMYCAGIFLALAGKNLII